MTPKRHGVIRGQCVHLYDPKGHGNLCGRLTWFMTPKGHGVIRVQRDLLYDPKGNGDLCGQFDLVYYPKRSQGHKRSP